MAALGVVAPVVERSTSMETLGDLVDSLSPVAVQRLIYTVERAEHHLA
jgi:hypothetical protein